MRSRSSGFDGALNNLLTCAQTHESVDCGSYMREKISFSSAPTHRVGGYLLVPKQRSGALPAVVALHDHGAYYLHGKEKLIALPEWPRFVHVAPLGEPLLPRVERSLTVDPPLSSNPYAATRPGGGGGRLGVCTLAMFE